MLEEKNLDTKPDELLLIAALDLLQRLIFEGNGFHFEAKNRIFYFNSYILYSDIVLETPPSKIVVRQKCSYKHHYNYNRHDYSEKTRIGIPNRKCYLFKQRK